MSSGWIYWLGVVGMQENIRRGVRRSEKGVKGE
jgi:hypothetical protein